MTMLVPSNSPDPDVVTVIPKNSTDISANSKLQPFSSTLNESPKLSMKVKSLPVPETVIDVGPSAIGSEQAVVTAYVPATDSAVQSPESSPHEE